MAITIAVQPGGASGAGGPQGAGGAQAPAGGDEAGFTKEDLEKELGQEIPQEVFDKIDKNGDGKISFKEMMEFIKSQGGGQPAEGGGGGGGPQGGGGASEGGGPQGGGGASEGGGPQGGGGASEGGGKSIEDLLKEALTKAEEEGLEAGESEETNDTETGQETQGNESPDGPGETPGGGAKSPKGGGKGPKGAGGGGGGKK